MLVYKFKVYFEDDENVYREIEIKANQSFEDLHNAIQKSINFDDKFPASFFISNDTWRKGKEIKLLRDKKGDAKKDLWMHDAKIAPYMEDPHQKLIYEFDPQNTCWTLNLELLKIIPESPVTYPRISKSKGIAPLQYKITTPVEIVEDDDEEESKTPDEDDNYVKNLADHYVEPEKEDELEQEIQVRVKSTGDGEEMIEEESVTGEKDEEADFEEEDFN